MVVHTILVVDDSPTSVSHTSEILEGNGYRVVSAANGEEALEVAEQLVPDLIVLDIIIPKKNGFQVCRHLRNNEQTQHIKVLLLSSKNQDTDVFWGKKQGANGYLTKPFDPAELLDCVESLLREDTAASVGLFSNDASE